MPAGGDKYMWLMVFFDLPVTTKEARQTATRFRNFLLKDGYVMLQYSVYARVCNGAERVDKHLKRLQTVLPKKGSIRALQVTEQQYGRMKILLGNQVQNEKKGAEQLLLF
jgi:CRISPR-associated protein Cas2